VASFLIFFLAGHFRPKIILYKGFLRLFSCIGTEDAPRDVDKLRRLLEIKQKQKEETVHIEDTERLVTEERLKCSR
jgi:hypothetical protein